MTEKDFELRVEGPTYITPEALPFETHGNYMRRLASSFRDWVRAQRVVVVPREHAPPPPRGTFVAVYKAPDGLEYYGFGAAEKYLEDRRNGLVY